MNITIMNEWLHTSYRHISPVRKVLLNIDNFQAHLSSAELTPPLPNILICWLPANSTSQFQPLDQGIIQSFKAHYRQQWLSYMLHCFNADRNPMDIMNVHLAIRWTLWSWNNYLLNTIIYNCFRKSILLTTPISLSTIIVPSDLPELYEQVVRVGNIQDFMAISNFLNPDKESINMEDNGHAMSEEEILNEILDEHLGVRLNQNDDEEDMQPERPVRTLQSVQQAIQILIDYTETQEALQANCRAVRLS